MSKSKKVVLFIVEGPSDETALGAIYERLLVSSAVKFDVVHGDLTVNTGYENSAKDVRDAVRKHVIDYLSSGDKGYRWNDIARIVQICDTDGVFIPETAITKSTSNQLLYTETHIETDNVQGIKRRNEKKRNALRQLSGIEFLTYKNSKVPYSLYFLSRNLEHALHGRADECTDEEKDHLAHQFRRAYAGNLNKFNEFLEEISVPGDYRGSWDYIQEDINSLSRGSNLHLILA